MSKKPLQSLFSKDEFVIINKLQRLFPNVKLEWLKTLIAQTKTPTFMASAIVSLSRPTIRRILEKIMI